MIIQNIEIKNWCQLEGNHSLSLINNSNNNVVLVGEGYQSGKNTFYSALCWCLYKYIPDSWKDNACLSGKTSVCVELIYEDTTYRIIRSCNHRKDLRGYTCVDESFVVQQQISSGQWIDNTTRILENALSNLRYFTYKEMATYPPDDAKYIRGFIKDKDVFDESFLKNFNTIANDSLEIDWIKTKWNIAYDKEHIFRIPNPETGKGNLFPLLDAGERMRMRLMLRAALAASVKPQLPLIVDGAIGYSSPNHVGTWLSILKKYDTLFPQWILFVESERLKDFQEQSKGDLPLTILN